MPATRADDCSIMIATHNRCDDLRQTLYALLKLNPMPREIIVCSDGCTDGTDEMLRKDFPQVRVVVHETPRGSVASRDELLRAAQGEFVLSLDDDSHPAEEDFLSYAREEFVRVPRLAVASFPQRSEEFPDSLECKDFGPSLLVGSYANSGAMLRRSTYLKLPGYQGFFFHAYEEPDYALQCIGAEYEVRLCTGRTIRHRYTAVNRNEIRIHQRHARNEALSIVMRCPLPQAFFVGAFRMVRQAGYAYRRGVSWLGSEPKWWVAFFRLLPLALAARQPIAWPRYLAWMHLVRSPMIAERHETCCD